MEKLNDKEREIFLENEKLLYFASKKYNIDFDLCCIGLCKAIKKYDENRGKFSTFAIMCMKTEKLNYIRKQKRQVEEINNIADCFFESKIDYNIEDDDRASNIFGVIIKVCTKRQQRILKEYYVKNKTEKEIAQQEEISPQRVSQILYCAIDKIRNMHGTTNINKIKGRKNNE